MANLRGRDQYVVRQAHYDRRKNAYPLRLVFCIDDSCSLPLLHIGAQGLPGTRGPLLDYLSGKRPPSLLCWSAHTGYRKPYHEGFERGFCSWVSRGTFLSQSEGFPFT